ncbi:ribosomal protein S16 domain-containing protein [Pelagophyceae sp. CCMP2097]|nr:ribosomal protein S16 domain-containing protein [Pelagophyceae sp. CCMP2097]
MPVRLRLQRWGRKHIPFYRIVVADARAPRDGKHIDRVGTYDPVPSKKDGLKEVRLNSERIKYWMQCGAQPTSRVAWLLGKAGLLPLKPQLIKRPEVPRPPKRVLDDSYWSNARFPALPVEDLSAYPPSYWPKKVKDKAPETPP